MMKRICAGAMAALMLFCTACSHESDVTGTDGPGTVTEPDTATVTETVTDAVTEPPFVDEEPVFYTNPGKDPVDLSSVDFSKTVWENDIKTANVLKNGVRGKYTDGARSAFTISNKTMSLTYHVLQNDDMIANSLCNSNGVPYFENTMDAYVRYDDGSYYVASRSLFSGRVNSHRLGYYYYDFRIRDQRFTNPETIRPYEEGEATVDLIAEYGDKFKGIEMKDVKCADGSLTCTVTGLTDPNIFLKGLDIDSSEFDAVQITILSETADILSLFLLVDGEGQYSPQRQLVHRFNAGEKTTIVIPCTLMDDLHGKITGIKIALGGKMKEKIEISDLRLLKRGGIRVPLLLERSYHTYPDKMHEQLRVIADVNYTGGGTFGEMIRIPEDTVRALVIKAEDGDERSALDPDFNFEKLEYVGFDIKNAGVFGMIMPLKTNGTVSVELKDGYYVITRERPMGKRVDALGARQLFHRLYTSDSHQFNDLRKEAYIERNPLTDIVVTDNSEGGRFVSYDQKRGCYDISVNGAGFVDAYYRTPDRQPYVEFAVSGDGAVDRTVYFNVLTQSGALECAAVLDQDKVMLPIPVQVSKNFVGEREESKYDPNDDSFGGEAYLPLRVGSDETKKLTVVHLYQNWGKYPLKQLSSISFIQPYYHLSIGVSESNCIAPYFVFGKDGWTLPDFRSNSTPLWRSQPQHTSIGRLFIVQHQTDSKSPLYMSEQQWSKIASSGPLYADISMDYLSDDGAFDVTYRHVELPQTDENRTYYEIRLKVLKDITITDFSKNFSLFKFDGRYAGAVYKKISYLDENNEIVYEDADTGRKRSRVVRLGTDHPYVAVYSPVYTVPGSEDVGTPNFAYIIKNSDIVINGEKYNGNLVFRDNALSNQTHLELSLDLGTVTLKKGDYINVDLILLPWGDTDSVNDSNVLAVRRDSCADPYKIEAVTGTVIEDTYVPSIRAENGAAEFTFSGGENIGVVRVFGLTSRAAPLIEMKYDGEWVPYDLSGPSGYDGYQVYYDEDGTYSFAFTADMTSVDRYEFRVTQK